MYSKRTPSINITLNNLFGRFKKKMLPSQALRAEQQGAFGSPEDDTTINYVNLGIDLVHVSL